MSESFGFINGQVYLDKITTRNVLCIHHTNMELMSVLV